MYSLFGFIILWFLTGLKDMSTTKQVLHLKFPCPDCGELLHFQRSDGDGKWQFNDRLYCQICKNFNDYLSYRSKIWVKVQTERRKQPGSRGKEILKEYQLQNPVQIDEKCWIIYDFGLSGKVYYFCDTEEYKFTDSSNKETQFQNVSELIDFLNSNIDNQRLLMDCRKLRGNQ